MTDWTNATPATASVSGVLRPDELARHLELDRLPAGPRVTRWVENHWFLRWDLPVGHSHLSQVITHPTVSLTSEQVDHPRPGVTAGGAVVLTGVGTRRFDVPLRGHGRVAGVRFRPGGLTALTGQSASSWTNRTLPANTVLPDRLCRALAEPGLVADPVAWAETADHEIALLDPGVDPRHEELLVLVSDMLADRSLVTVRQLADRYGVSSRTLQRLFLHYVGVGPKWVLARYRMHNVVTDIDDGYDGTLGALAHHYGWYDQAHFIRDFVSLVGVTPGDYREG